MEIAPGLHAIRVIGANVFCALDDEITLIDAGHRGSSRIIRAYLERHGRRLQEVTRIVCTHGHPDHIGGVHEIAAATGARVLLHAADAERLRITLRDVISDPRPGGIVALLTRAPENAVSIADGDVIPALGGLEVLHTPGHTPGSICLWSARDGLLLVGDVLQRDGRAVTLPNPFFTDDMGAARRSIARLAELDVRTIVFSHYPPLREGARHALRALVTDFSSPQARD